MSCVVKNVNGRTFGNIIRADGGNYYYVDSAWTPDNGWETMAFKYDYTKEVVTEWLEVYLKHYSTFEEMMKSHLHLVEHFENVPLIQWD